MFNASKTLPQMLHSVVGQSYPNWKVILIDDVSDKYEQVECNGIIFGFRELMSRCSDDPNKINITWNSDGRGKRWETENVLYGVSICDDDDIIVRLDADDHISDMDALWILNEAYDKHGVDCLWTAHRWFDSERLTNISISGPLSNDDDPYQTQWKSSHMKTFRKRLLNGVNDLNFRDKDGEYIRRAGDQAIFLPVLHQSRSRGFLNVVMYSYRCEMKNETFESDDAKEQKLEAEFLRRRGFVE